MRIISGNAALRHAEFSSLVVASPQWFNEPTATVNLTNCRQPSDIPCVPIVTHKGLRGCGVVSAVAILAARRVARRRNQPSLSEELACPIVKDKLREDKETVEGLV